MRALPVAVLTGMLSSMLVAQGPSWLAGQDVTWRSPGPDASASMPIGNGEVGCNVWCCPDGTLQFYVARSDSFSETSRLLKLGKVTLQVRRPEDGEFFEQRLCLREGCIRVTWGEGERRIALRLFVDAAADVIHVVGDAAREQQVAVQAMTWRTQARRLTGGELQSSWTMKDAPGEVVVEESADLGVAPRDETARLGSYHRNERSVVPFTAERQGLGGDGLVPDPLLHRMFGLLLGGRGAGAGHVRDLRAPVLLLPRGKRFALQIAAPCVQTEQEAHWLVTAGELLDEADPDLAAQRTEQWWRGFWERSHVSVTGDASARRLTQALVLQRWVQACGGRGRYPIKFNGGIFTVEPKPTGGQVFDADWRRWGDCFWWQNTRLPYYPMLAQGDFEMTTPLFRLYRDTLPVAEARARVWHGVRGGYWPETMTPFGTHANGDYGWEREGLPASKVLCPWWEHARNQGLELVALMLERFDYEREPAFVHAYLLPIAEGVLEWFATAYPRDSQGTLRITPTQALETYWDGVRDDLPTVAGLHWVVPRLLALPEDLTTAEQRERWTALLRALPPIPIREQDGVRMLAPAAEFDPRRRNVENPELYAVFPFRIYGLGKPDLEMARATFRQRPARHVNGWPQDGQCAALLGLAGEAKRILLAKLDNSHPAHRFPVMWGPNFDWCPDQCHGGNLLDLCHRMLLQCDGDVIRVLPCWPDGWDVSFKLHAPRRTTVELDYRRGKLERLVVTPAARAKDVVVGAD